MNILALIIDKDSLQSVVDYANKIADDKDQIHLLNIVSTAGNIPTKKTSGEIVDGCTEFDVSAYYNERRDNQKWFNDFDSKKEITSKEAIIGNKKVILNHQIDKHHIDLIITSTEQSSDIEDYFKHTAAGLVYDIVNVPVLAFKCDRSREDITDIGIVSDFSNPTEHNLALVKHIAQISGATISLYGMVTKEDDSPAMIERMNHFAEAHNLSNTKNQVLVSKQKEKSAHDILMTYPIQLMVLMDIQRQGIQKILRGSLEKDILNHQLVPILAYK